MKEGGGVIIPLVPLFSTPGEVSNLAVNSDVHVIRVSSQAAGHLSLFTALRDELRMRRISRRTRGWGGEKEG